MMELSEPKGAGVSTLDPHPAENGAAMSATAPRKAPRLHLPFLDGIRGLAALWVMVCHLYGHFISGLQETGSPLAARLNPLSAIFGHGKDGVAVFIVLSGFCLMLPVVPSGGALRSGFANFFQRRALRILPPYYGAIVLSLLTTYASHLTKARLGIADTGGDIWKENFAPGTIVTHLLLIHNWFPQWNTTLNTVMWSVAEEWQIYFLFALLLLPLWAVIARKSGPLKASLGVAAVGYVAGLLPVLVLPASYNFEWTCPWYLGLFALGMLGAVVTVGDDAKLTRLRERAPWLVLALVSLAIGLAERFGIHARQEYIDPFLAIAALSLMLYCVRARTTAPHRPTLVLRFLESRPAVLIGAFSYSLYLTHGNVHTRLSSFLLSRHFTGARYGLALGIGGIVIPLLFAYAFYLVMEKPFIAARRRAGATAANTLPQAEPAAA